MTSCFIYLYFFSGSVPIFLSCIPAPGHPISVATFILNVMAAIAGKAIFFPWHLCMCLSCWDPEVILISTCAHTLTYSTRFPGYRGAPTGSHFNVSSWWGWPAHCHHVEPLFSTLACKGKKSFWFFKNTATSQVWWQTPIIPALGRLRQEDLEFKASLGFIASSGQPGLHNETLSQKIKITATEDLYPPCLSDPPHKETLWDSQSSWEQRTSPHPGLGQLKRENLGHFRVAIFPWFVPISKL
jgi:hypothetical protein